MENRFFPNYEGCIVTSKFGVRKDPFTCEQKKHNGIDLVASNDGKIGQCDRIMAHTGGTVVSEGYDDVVGYFCNIEVSNNVTMVYRHLNARCNLRTGDKVKQGDVIGYMGKSGRATGAHLHFGIKDNGKWVDPLPYINSDYPLKPSTKPVELPVLKRGSKGCAVSALQTLLTGMGYNIGEKGVDGSFGKMTGGALKQFQSDRELKPDESCGPITWAEIITKFGGR